MNKAWIKTIVLFVHIGPTLAARAGVHRYHMVNRTVDLELHSDTLASRGGCEIYAVYVAIKMAIAGGKAVGGKAVGVKVVGGGKAVGGKVASGKLVAGGKVVSGNAAGGVQHVAQAFFQGAAWQGASEFCQGVLRTVWKYFEEYGCSETAPNLKQVAALPGKAVGVHTDAQVITQTANVHEQVLRSILQDETIIKTYGESAEMKASWDSLVVMVRILKEYYEQQKSFGEAAQEIGKRSLQTNLINQGCNFFAFGSW